MFKKFIGSFWTLLGIFVMLSFCDLGLTLYLLRHSAGQVYETNPLARAWMSQFGELGLAYFKIAVVLITVICTTCIHLKGYKKSYKTKYVLYFGIPTMLMVLIYSISVMLQVDTEEMPLEWDP